MSKENKSGLEVQLNRCINKIPDISDICNALTNTSNKIMNFFKKEKNQENKNGDCTNATSNNYCNVKNFAFQQCPKIYQGKQKRKRKFEPETGGDDNSCRAKRECKRKTTPNPCAQTPTSQQTGSQTYGGERITNSEITVRAGTSQINCTNTCICNHAEQKFKIALQNNNDSIPKNNKNDQKVPCTPTKYTNRSPRSSSTAQTSLQTASNQSDLSKCSTSSNETSESQETKKEDARCSINQKSPTNKNCNSDPTNIDINATAIQILCSNKDGVKVSSSFVEQLAMVCLNPETSSITSPRAIAGKSVTSKSNTPCKNASKNKKYKYSSVCKSRSELSKSIKSMANNGYRLWVTIKPVIEDQDESTETECESDCSSKETKATTCTPKPLSTCSKRSTTPKSSICSSIQKSSEEKNKCTPITTQATCSKKDKCLDENRKRNEKIIAVAKGWWGVLYRNNNGDEDCECVEENWRKLSSAEKLLYIWAAIGNQIVADNPKQNFIFDYTMDKDIKKCRMNKRGQINEIWKCLSAHERLPYILEALIAKISACEVNISDVNCVQDTLQKLEKC